MTQLEWIHPNPSAVERFFVLYAFSPEEREKPTAIEAGKPLQVDRFVWGIDVPEKSSVWVAVVAEGVNGQRSPPSEWRRYDWRPGQGRLEVPGQPYLVQEAPK